MLFNTLRFLLLFPVIFAVYWTLPIRWQMIRKSFLLCISYLLYINFCPVHTFVLLGITIVTYIGGGIISKTQHRKLYFWLFLFLSLLPLLFFKYYNFICENISFLLAFSGFELLLPGLNWAIPIGISFFSFQAVGYMVDVYLHKIKPERNIIDYMLFISFFPQITSGPISKASELLAQIKSVRYFDYSQAVSGLRCLLWGMFLKVVLADRAGIYVDTVFSEYERISGAGCMLASFLYSIQIYADFAGYSLMAVGLGKLLGFNLVNNFNRPYFSVSITDFWRRWHISLSRWLKDYVYISMGGSRCSKLRNYWNIFITFLVSGIWHGANWTFIIWGIIHGLCQIVEKYFGWNKDYKGIARLFRIFITFIIVTIAWTIFRSPSIGESVDYFNRFFSTSGDLAAGPVFVYILIALLPVVVFEVLSEFFPSLYKLLRRKVFLRWVVYLTVFSMIMLIGVYDGSSFIYVSF